LSISSGKIPVHRWWFDVQTKTYYSDGIKKLVSYKIRWKAAVLSIKLKHVLTYMQSFASTYSKIGLLNYLSSQAEIELKSLQIYFNAVSLHLYANKNYYVLKNNIVRKSGFKIYFGSLFVGIVQSTFLFEHTMNCGCKMRMWARKSWLRISQ